MATEAFEGAPTESAKLRQELKDWEYAFAAANGGRKARRDDIKKNPAIASKYKEYTKLRSVSSNIVPADPSSKPRCQESRSKSKRKSVDLTETPSKRPRSSQSFATPSKSTKQSEVYDSPAVVRNLVITPPIFRTSLGPTPQRDGKALGLFDLLTPTPAKNDTQATPSKLRSTSTFGQKKLAQPGRTPPKPKPSRSSNPVSQTPATPQSTHSSQLLITPAFLRRDSYRFTHDSPFGPDKQADSSIQNTSNYEVTDSPVLVRMPAAPPKRGLSYLLAGLRRAQEEQLDEIEEAARTADEGYEDVTSRAKVMVADSQMPLGPDGQAIEVEADEKEKDKDGEGEDKGKKGWRKKGQKRTTRRVVIRPNRSKASVAQRDDNAAEAEEGDGPAMEDKGSDEKQVGAKDDSKNRQHNDWASSDDDMSDFLDDEAKTPSKKQKKPSKPESKPKDAEVAKGKKGPKKINPNANSHANFKRLKLRNRGGGGGGRYGRRR
ncbi:MAG: DNA replication regulator sld2 [Vezdaea aestivalis]|nr:MAG: DNA replication regulator sld2 [Vezdaea aestivalis]